MGRGGVADEEGTEVPQLRNKRKRRLASQIDRNHPCSFPGCKKSYGSDGALKLHFKRKHRNIRHSLPRHLASAPLARLCGAGQELLPRRPGFVPPTTAESSFVGLHSLDMAAHYEQQVALQLQLQQQMQLEVPQNQHTLRASPWSYPHPQTVQGYQTVHANRPIAQQVSHPGHAAVMLSHGTTGPESSHSHPSYTAVPQRGSLFSSVTYPMTASCLFGSHHYQHMALATQLNKIRIGSWVQHLHPETGLVFSVDDIRRDLCYTVELPQMLLRIVVGFESVASIKADAEGGDTQISVQVKDSPAFYKTDPTVMPTTWTMTEDFTNGMATTFATHQMSAPSMEFAEQLFSVLLADEYFKDQSQEDEDQDSALHHDPIAHSSNERNPHMGPLEYPRHHLTPIAPPTLPVIESVPRASGSLGVPVSESGLDDLELQRRQRHQLQQRQRQRRQQGAHQRDAARAEELGREEQHAVPTMPASYGRTRVEGMLNDCETILRHQGNSGQLSVCVESDHADTVVLSNGTIAEAPSTLYDPSFDWSTVDYANQLPIPQLR